MDLNKITEDEIYTGQAMYKHMSELKNDLIEQRFLNKGLRRQNALLKFKLLSLRNKLLEYAESRRIDSHMNLNLTDVEPLLNKCKLFRDDIDSMKGLIKKQTKTVNKLTDDCCQQVIKSTDNIKGEIEEKYQTEIEYHKECARQLKEKCERQGEQIKVLHNCIIELRGNIRVHCRLRPLIENEKSTPTGNQEVIQAIDEETIEAVLLNKQIRTYQYERAYSKGTDQSTVFREVEPVIHAFVQGSNACIMAYGETGSGKTYTMMGCNGDDKIGIIPRSIKSIYKLAREILEDYQIFLSIVEVYNNDVYDLIAMATSIGSTSRHLIMNKSDGSVHTPTVTNRLVISQQQVCELIDSAVAKRSQTSTAVHGLSSRSHLIITLTLRNNKNSTTSKMQLVDLAGSECVAVSGTKAEHFRETSCINRSLSALSDVLGALSEQRSHIPYRNSRLTHILSDVLGGDAKLLIIVCISPSLLKLPESLQCLHFGQRARQIQQKNRKSPLPEQVVSIKATASAKTPSTSNLTYTANKSRIPVRKASLT